MTSLRKVLLPNGDPNFTSKLILSLQVWERAEEFIPERFDLEGPVPNESNTDYRQVTRP